MNSKNTNTTTTSNLVDLIRSRKRKRGKPYKMRSRREETIREREEHNDVGEGVKSVSERMRK